MISGHSTSTSRYLTLCKQANTQHQNQAWRRIFLISWIHCARVPVSTSEQLLLPAALLCNLQAKIKAATIKDHSVSMLCFTEELNETGCCLNAQKMIVCSIKTTWSVVNTPNHLSLPQLEVQCDSFLFRRGRSDGPFYLSGWWPWEFVSLRVEHTNSTFRYLCVYVWWRVSEPVTKEKISLFSNLPFIMLD